MRTTLLKRLAPAIAALLCGAVVLACQPISKGNKTSTNNGTNNDTNNGNNGPIGDECTKDDQCDANMICERGNCVEGCRDDAEPNDTVEGATDVPETRSWQNLTVCGDDRDVFVIHLGPAEDAIATINFSNAGGDIDMEVRDPADNIIVSSRTSNDTERILLPATGQEQTYYIIVYGFQGINNHYDLEIEVDPDGDVCERQADCLFGFTCTDNICLAPPLCDDPHEVNNGPRVATPIRSGQTISDANVCGTTDVDWYAFDVTDAGTNAYVQVTFSHRDADIDVRLRDESLREIDLGDSATDNEFVVGLDLDPGRYYIELTPFVENEGNYSLTLTLDPPLDLCDKPGERCTGGTCSPRRVCLPANSCETNDDCADLAMPSCTAGACICSDMFEPNDTRETAANINANLHPRVQLSTCDGQDWFQFTATEGQTIEVSVVFSYRLGDVELDLLDSAGDIVEVSHGGDNDEFISIPNAPAGDYFIHVFIANDVVRNVPYYLDVTLR